MGIEESHEDRLMAHAMPGDDPTWGEVSAFMEAVDSAYAEVPTTQYETAHLAALAGAARSIRNGLHTSRRKTMKDLFVFKSHRVLIASVVAGLLALTAGVGAASALGGGPLANLFPAAPTEVSTAPEVTAVPTATASEIEDEADDESDDQGEDEGDDPTPKATPTSTHDDDESGKATQRSRSHDSDEGDDEKAGKTHDEGDDDQGDDHDDQGDDHDSKAGSHSGDQDDDNGDDDGHGDDSED